MSCCAHCKATDAQFGPEVARRDLARYRRKGPDKTTRLMLDGIRGIGVRGGHLLDVGAGIGVLHHELLGAVIHRATHVEAASAYVTAAREEDERRGREDVVEYKLGNAVDLADALAPADVVTLDRVICCYPDWERLVRSTAAQAESVYAFSMPHDRRYVRLGLSLVNLKHRLRREAFRVFAHPVVEVERLLDDMGFHRVYLRRTLLWHIALYGR